MNVYKNGIQIELMKLVKRRKFKWLIALTMVFTLLILFGLFGFQQLTGTNGVQTGQTMGWVLRQMMWFILPLFTAMIAVDIFSAENSRGAMKSTLLLPISRYKIYLSKAVVLATVIMTLLLSIYVVTLSFGAVLFGIGNLGAGVLSLLIDYVAAALPLILLGLMVGLISQFLKASSTIMTFSVIGYIVMNLVGGFFSGLYLYIPTSYMQWYRYDAFSSMSTSMLMFMIAYIIMFMTVGIFRFDKQEL